MKEYKSLKRKISICVFIALGFCLLAITATAQDSTRQTKNLRNSIKINITAGILYNKALQFSYERVLSPYRSINIFAGYNEFPSGIRIDLENTAVSKMRDKSGFMVGADYRFYLKQENKYEAPHGLYVGPYTSFYQFNGKRSLTHTDTTGSYTSGLNSKINFFSLGGELGYQFALGKHLVIDAVMLGPAFTHYKFKANIEGDIPGLDENEAVQKIIAALKDKLPFLQNLAEDREVSGTGAQAFWSVGFRYNISIGYRF